MAQINKHCHGLESLLSPELFKALCDPRRIAIVAWLAESCGPKSVSEVAACCPTDLSVVSRHLATLRAAGVLEATKCGRQVFYRVRSSELVSALRRLADAIEACCPPD